jgi:hypothetical protein
MLLDRKISVLPSSKGYVYDKNGFPIYSAKPGKRFNIPSGNFDLDFSYDLIPVFYYPDQRIKLPRSEKPNGNRLIRSVSYAPGVERIAIIQAKSGTIILDESLLNTPEFIHDFVLFHEIGHIHYKTEEYCDLYSMKCMLEKGWNPSQVMIAKGIISDRDRQKFIDKKLEAFRK